jgi:hypothetical protein
MGSLFLILNTKTVSQKGEIILGFGAFITWISLMKFYQNVKGYNIVANTLENSFEIVFKSLTGVMPIFIGYGVLGTSIFWRSHRFTDFSTSMFSLFAVMNGDMIFDAWHDIDTIDYLLAQLYLYSFIFFSICVVLNTFIVVIEDGYIMQKFFARTDWVKGVNQRSSLHTVEMMMRQQAMDGEGGEGVPEGEIDDAKTNKSSPMRRDTQMSRGSSGSKPRVSIPMLLGAPLPHDGDPFIRMIKKTKKDVKSRRALIKMLRHEKLEILIDRRNQKLYHAHQSPQDLDTEADRIFEDFGPMSREDPAKFEIVEVKKVEAPEPPANTPEAIARRISELMKKLEEMKEKEVLRMRNTPDEEGQIQDLEERYSHNYAKIRQVVDSYARVFN